MTDATAAPKTDRYHRAPRGGCVCPLTGRFFRGGQFLPLATVEELARLASPAALEGSSRQVLWAARLRREALAGLDAEIHARRLFLGSPIRAEVRENRRAIRTFLLARHRLAGEKSAAAIIERRAMA